MSLDHVIHKITWPLFLACCCSSVCKGRCHVVTCLCVLNNGCRHCWVEVDTTNHFAIRSVWIGLQLRPGLRYLFFLVQVKERREVRPLEIPAQAFLEQQPLCQVSLFQELSYINKSCPTTRHTGAKGERKYSFCSLLTSTLEGVSGQRHALAALYPGKGPTAYCKGGRVSPRAGLDTAVSGKSLTSAGDQTPIVQSVARHCTELPRLQAWQLFNICVRPVINQKHRYGSLNSPSSPANSARYRVANDFICLITLDSFTSQIISQMC
jgi:hypothetical protein